MPWDRSKYPSNWGDIVRQVKERAGDECEWENCRVPNGIQVRRCVANRALYVAIWAMPVADPKIWSKPVKVVLTTAHTCECDPLCGNLDHLMLLCQYHHLNFDARLHAKHAIATRRRKLEDAGQAVLFDRFDRRDE